MATSMASGQMAISCKLCEMDQKIKWICIQCNVKMCEKCEKVHGKLKSSSEHTILDIKEVCTDKMPTRMPDFTKMKCQIHPEQYCCLFCAKCDTLVCPECVMLTHKKHKLRKISKEYETKLANSEKFKAELQQEMKSQKEFKIELRKIQALQRQGFSKTREDILLQEETLIQAVKDLSRKFQDEIEKKHKANLRKIEEKENEINNTIENLQAKNSDIDNLLRLDGSANIFTEKNPFSLPMGPNFEVVRADLAVASKLLPGDAKTISSVFGRLQDNVCTDMASPRILCEFSTELKAFDIHATADGIIWINNYNIEKLLKTKIEGKELKILAEFNKQVRSSLYKNGDLLVAPLFESVLKMIKSGKENVENTMHDITPGELTAVHINQQENKILIGAIAEGQALANNESQLIIMDRDGNTEKVFHYDAEGQPLLTFIGSITCTNQGTIGVIDIISNYPNKGKVIILNMHGQVHKYDGNSSINITDQPFAPNGIIASPWNNFIIAESFKHYIHILDQDGCFLTLINTKELGIEKPNTLCLTDHLFIGCGKTKDQKNAKIYKLDNFPW